ASLRQQPVIDVWTQPSCVSQVSAVQRAPSSQLSGVPSWQPSTGSQVSTPSHASPSSHCSGVPGTQSPLTHLSSPLHTLLSMQSASLWQQPWIDVFMQPKTELQLSYVQRAPSLQSGAVPGWQPLVGSQVSVPLHGSPSSHWSGVPAPQLWVPGSHGSVPLRSLLARQ